jgi:CRISPR system Cascade subunit CasE
MSHWFSILELDATHPEAAEALHERQRLMRGGRLSDHAWLWRLFSPDAQATRDFLFRRIERADGSSREAFRYYLVSAREPVLVHPAWQLRTRAYDPAIAEGAQLEFEVRVNPVVTINRVRHDVVMHAKRKLCEAAGAESWSALVKSGHPEAAVPGAQFVSDRVAEWVLGAPGRPGFAERNGFSISCDGSGVPVLRVDAYARHALTDKARGASITTVDLRGALEVRDAERFRHALLNGIGHGKVYGCGLLLVRPAFDQAG